MDIIRFCFVEIVTLLWGVVVPEYVCLVVMYITCTEKQKHLVLGVWCEIV